MTDEDAHRNENNARAEPPSFGELDASRGMLALSHQNLTDLTPRNLYEARNPRTSTEDMAFRQRIRLTHLSRLRHIATLIRTTVPPWHRLIQPVITVLLPLMQAMIPCPHLALFPARVN